MTARLDPEDLPPIYLDPGKVRVTAPGPLKVEISVPPPGWFLLLLSAGIMVPAAWCLWAIATGGRP